MVEILYILSSKNDSKMSKKKTIKLKKYEYKPLWRHSRVQIKSLCQNQFHKS